MGALVTALAIALPALGSVACEACRSPAIGTAAPETEPTLRLYLLSDPAGALEPCGCVKDQLGGVDHLAAFIDKERANAKNSALVAAGPLFFMDKELKADRASQDKARAEAMASALHTLNLLAFAPGENDAAGGEPQLQKLRDLSGAELLDGKGAIRDVGSVKVGLIGIGPQKDGAPSASDRVKTALADLKGKGAQVFVVLAATGRGEAKRIADNVPELTAIVVGTPGTSGEANTDTPSGERIGNVLIAETGNHVQTVGVLDLYVRDGSYTFQDASSLDQARKLSELSSRIDELRGAIADLERDGKGQKPEGDEKRAALAKAESARDAFDHAPAPAKGSYARYRTQEVRPGFGSQPKVEGLMSAYYKKVNDENKMSFAGKLPRPPADGEPSYVGVAACAKCHEDAKKVWDKTAHSHAYATLSTQFKEFNLDCVSCHVTGYDRPGGATVTHVDGLTDVQCEVCHGPGSKHAANPSKAKILVAKPSADSCTSCHHPPHVHSFDGPTKLQQILGPGHGRPKT